MTAEGWGVVRCPGLFCSFGAPYLKSSTVWKQLAEDALLYHARAKGHEGDTGRMFNEGMADIFGGIR